MKNPPDNVRPHVSKVMLTFFAQKKIKLMPHLAYSADLVSSNFFLFPNLKKELKGRRFSPQEEIMGTVQVILKRLSKNRFEIMLEKWARNWEKCIAFGVASGGGGFFEGA